MVERLIKAGHLRRYIKDVDREEEYTPIADKATTGVAPPSEPRPTISYILRGPLDEQYQSKCQQMKLLRAATVKAWVNAVHTRGSWEETKPIGDPISFSPINLYRVIVPHYDALIPTLCINDFDVHRVLVDPGSDVDLLQLLAFNQMKLSSQMLNSAERILFSFNDATTLTLETSHFLYKQGQSPNRFCSQSSKT